MSYYEDGEGDMEETQSYVQYLEKQGVIKFTSNIRNGYLLYINDLMGQELVFISISLYMGKREMCKTPLTFIPFKRSEAKLHMLKNESDEYCRIKYLREKILNESGK